MMAPVQKHTDDEPILTQSTFSMPVAYLGGLLLAVGMGAYWVSDLTQEQQQSEARISKLEEQLEPSKPRWGADDHRNYASEVRQEFLQLRTELDNHRTGAERMHTEVFKQINEVYEIQDDEIQPELAVLRARMRLVESKLGVFDPRNELDQLRKRTETGSPE